MPVLGGLESGAGLDVVIWLQAHGNGFFDALGIALHAAGSEVFYLAMLALLMWAVDRRLGVRLLFALILASVVTETLKNLFQTPRPHLAYPEQVTALVAQGGFGMPSGHVLIGLVVWGYLAWRLRRRAVTLLVGGYVLLLGWSRMYVGVHYPQDVLVGLIVGGLLLWGYVRFADGVAAWWWRASLGGQIAVIVACSLLVVLLTVGSADGLALGGLLLGIGPGLLWAERSARFSARGSLWRRGLRLGGGLVILLAVFFGGRVLFAGLEPPQLWRMLRYAIVGATAIALWPWLCLRLGLAMPD